MSENLVQYTEHELLTRYIIRMERNRIHEANQAINLWQSECNHRHVNVEHKRVDSHPPEFYSNMRCLVCDKRWTEEGSK